MLRYVVSLSLSKERRTVLRLGKGVLGFEISGPATVVTMGDGAGQMRRDMDTGELLLALENVCDELRQAAGWNKGGQGGFTKFNIKNGGG